MWTCQLHQSDCIGLFHNSSHINFTFIGYDYLQPDFYFYEDFRISVGLKHLLIIIAFVDPLAISSFYFSNDSLLPCLKTRIYLSIYNI